MKSTGTTHIRKFVMLNPKKDYGVDDYNELLKHSMSAESKQYNVCTIIYMKSKICRDKIQQWQFSKSL